MLTKRRSLRTASGLMALALLSACASQTATNALSDAQQNYAVIAQACQAGDQAACNTFAAAHTQLVTAQQQYSTEQQHSAAVTAEVLGAAALIGLSVAAFHH